MGLGIIIAAHVLLNLHDVLVKFIELLRDFGEDTSGPVLLDTIKLFQGLLLLLCFNVLVLTEEDLINFSVRSGDDVDEEVVHNISIVSSECQTLRS